MTRLRLEDNRRGGKDYGRGNDGRSGGHGASKRGSPDGGLSIKMSKTGIPGWPWMTTWVVAGEEVPRRNASEVLTECAQEGAKSQDR